MLAAGVRILVAYLVFYAALGAAYPFLPVFYHDLGLALDEIGLLIAVQSAIMLVCGPVWGGLSDRFPRSRLALPLAAMVEVDFPTRGPGYLDISRADDALRNAIKLHLIDNITVQPAASTP